MTQMLKAPVPSEYVDFFIPIDKGINSKVIESFETDKLKIGKRLVLSKDSRNKMISYSDTFNIQFSIENEYKKASRVMYIIPVTLSYTPYLKKNQPKLISHKKCTVFYNQLTTTFSYDNKLINIIDISPNYSAEELYKRVKK